MACTSLVEWTTLNNYLGGSVLAGGKMKETGNTHWSAPNKGATNSSGFTGLPGGLRDNYGSFWNINNYGYWWSSMETSASEAYAPALYSVGTDLLYSGGYKFEGFSVRCIKD